MMCHSVTWHLTKPESYRLTLQRSTSLQGQGARKKEPISRSFTLRQHNNLVFKNWQIGDCISSFLLVISCALETWTAVNDFLVRSSRKYQMSLLSNRLSLLALWSSWSVSPIRWHLLVRCVLSCVYRFSFSISNIVIATAIYNIYSSSILSKAIIKWKPASSAATSRYISAGDARPSSLVCR